MIKHRDYFFKDRLYEYTEKLLIPFSLLMGAFIIISLLTELFFGFGTGDTMGETTAFANLMQSIGKLFSKVLFMLISSIVAISVSDELSLPAGILGGYLSAFGYSYSFPSGSITGSSGLFGAIISGLIAGVSIKLLRRFSGEGRGVISIIYTLISISLTVFLALGMGSLSEEISNASTMTLGALMNYKNPLVYILIGLFTVVNPGSSMYISTLSFSSAMVSSGEFTPAASVIGASLAPLFSLFITALLSLRSLSVGEKINRFSGLIFAFGGVTVSSVPYYLLHPLKAILSFSLGSALSAYLAYSFNVGAENLKVGFLGADRIQKPWLLLLAILCGALLASAVNLLLTKTPKRKKHRLTR